jgi:hypothetical protein
MTVNLNQVAITGNLVRDPSLVTLEAEAIQFLARPGA